MPECHFAAVREPDSEEPSRFDVRIAALPGCPMYGASLKNAMTNAHEPVAGYVESLLADSGPIPTERRPIVAARIADTRNVA